MCVLVISKISIFTSMIPLVLGERYRGKHRSEVCAAQAAELHGFQVLVKLHLAGDLCIFLDRSVALDDVDVDFREKAPGGLQYVIGLLQEALDHLSGHGAGGVDGDDELSDALDLLVFQRFDQGHFLVELHAVGVENMVEFVVIDAHGLAHDRKFPEKGRVVVALPVDFTEVLHQVPGQIPLLCLAKASISICIRFDSSSQRASP